MKIKETKDYIVYDNEEEAVNKAKTTKSPVSVIKSKGEYYVEFSTNAPFIRSWEQLIYSHS